MEALKCALCGIAHFPIVEIFEHLSHYSDDFGTNVCPDLVNCSRIAWVQVSG